MGPATMLTLATLLLIAWSSPVQTAELTIQLIGNAGVMLSDSVTSVLVDLPYEPGAFGYMRYDPAGLEPPGGAVSVITHHHRDHFDASLFRSRPSWRIVGPPSVTADLSAERVLDGDSVQVGAFAIVAVRTPHTDDHRSYRIRWRGRVLYFVGDTEDPPLLLQQDAVDVLFITPWLSCAVAATGRSVSASRAVVYHGRPDGSDRTCGSVEALPQGTTFSLPSAGS